MQPPAKLVHLDAHLENVLVQDGEVTGLVDFDDAEIAPPEVDVWWLLYSVVEDGEVTAEDAIGWLRDRFPAVFQAPGMPERLVLNEVVELLWGLTQAEAASRITPEEAREESELTYHRLFESDFYGPWFSAFAGP